MLVLSRKPSQQVAIGDNVEVTVISVSGGRVKLGFSAPDNVPIHRGEVRRHMQLANCESALQQTSATPTMLSSPGVRADSIATQGAPTAEEKGVR